MSEQETPEIYNLRGWNNALDVWMEKEDKQTFFFKDLPDYLKEGNWFKKATKEETIQKFRKLDNTLCEWKRRGTLVAACFECGCAVKPQQAKYTKDKFGHVLCLDCEGCLPHVYPDTSIGHDWQDTKPQQFQEVNA